MDSCPTTCRQCRTTMAENRHSRQFPPPPQQYKKKYKHMTKDAIGMIERGGRSMKSGEGKQEDVPFLETICSTFVITKKLVNKRKAWALLRKTTHQQHRDKICQVRFHDRQLKESGKKWHDPSKQQRSRSKMERIRGKESERF